MSEFSKNNKNIDINKKLKKTTNFETLVKSNSLTVS